MESSNELPLIAVDIGNSSIECGLFVEGVAIGIPGPVATLSLPHDGETIARLAEWLPPSCQWCVASVNQPAFDNLTAWLHHSRPHDRLRQLFFSDFPLQLEVEHPEQVGVDRLAAVTAANVLRPTGQPAIVIDGGTAITVNVLDAAGAFRGGAILPGFRLSALALARNTDALPLVHFDAQALPPAIGTTTETALRSGVFWGAVGALRELLERVSGTLPSEPAIYLTGGGADLFVGHLARQADFVPHLVLSGIAIAQSRCAPLASDD